MPTAKKSSEKKSAPKPSASKKIPLKKQTATSKPTAAKKEQYTDEYLAYLERYELMGEGRPRLKPREFDQLDDEFLDLIETQFEGRLDDDQTIRLKELEYLLLDPEQ